MAGSLVHPGAESADRAGPEGHAEAATQQASRSAWADQRPAWVEIDLGALGRNLARTRERVRPAAILAVVKADAYGHGAVEVSRRLEKAGVEWLGVALVEEGAKLRRAGIRAPLLVLGPVQAPQIPVALSCGLTPAVSSLEQLRMWQRELERVEPGRVVDVHLKVDTGMHRLGLDRRQWDDAARLLAAAPSLRLTGLLSHLAEAESAAAEATREQEAVFVTAVELFRRASAAQELVLHLANSAAALHRPSTRHDLVRMGLALYGVDPAARMEGLEGVMRVKARIVQVRTVEKGSAVGYGGGWIAPRRSRLGVVPVGYADGYPWRLGGRSRARVAGGDVAVVGAVNMDMLVLDLSESEAQLGSEVTLLAGLPEQGPTAAELAALAGSVPYEILCHFGLRLPKRYLAS